MTIWARRLLTPGSSMDKDAILTALDDVSDPEFPVSIVDMGLVVDANESNGSVHVAMTFTSMGCPGIDMILDDTRSRLLEEPGVKNVDIEIVWDPIWTSDRLSADARMALHELGIAI